MFGDVRFNGGPATFVTLSYPGGQLVEIMVESDLELQEAATGARRGQGNTR